MQVCFFLAKIASGKGSLIFLDPLYATLKGGHAPFSGTHVVVKASGRLTKPALPTGIYYPLNGAALE